MAARYEEGCYGRYIFTHFLVREGLSTDDVGVAKGTLFREIRPGELVSKPAISLKNSWGVGYRRMARAHLQRDREGGNALLATRAMAVLDRNTELHSPQQVEKMRAAVTTNPAL